MKTTLNREEVLYLSLDLQTIATYADQLGLPTTANIITNLVAQLRDSLTDTFTPPEVDSEILYLLASLQGFAVSKEHAHFYDNMNSVISSLSVFYFKQ